MIKYNNRTKKIRVGNDFICFWYIRRGFRPEDIINATDIVLTATNRDRVIPLEFSVVDTDTLKIEVKTDWADELGDYVFTVSYVLTDPRFSDDMRANKINKRAFKIVPKSEQANTYLELHLTSQVLTDDKGDPFEYDDFTPEQLALLKGDKGDVGPKGDQGEPGPKGDKGDQGPQGEQGPQGDKGEGLDYNTMTPEEIASITGAKGDKGDKGDQGVQGLPGNDGYTPQKGVDYFDGVKGDTGDKGDQGEKGDTGEQGIQGEIGPKGDTGEQGPIGLQGPKGDSFVYDDFTPTQLEGLKGPQGIQGPKGEDGPKGDKGIQGEQGIQGEEGEQGIQGDTGSKGDKGDTGIGVPIGGVTGQQLTKKSATDYDFEWKTPAGAGDMLKSEYDKNGNGIVDNAEKVGGFTVGVNVPANAKFTDTVYTHPTGTNPHGTTKADVGLGSVNNTSDANKPVSTAQQTAINSGVADAKTYTDEKSALAIPLTQKGTASGVAELDASGKVLSSQLPSYVDDVLNYTTLSNFPTTGESGKIYITEDANKTYRWTGSAYVEISPSIALGETTATAYRGDRGKIAYDHSQAAHAPSNAQKNSDITKAEIEAKLTGAITTHTHSAYVPTSRTVAGKALTGNITLAKGDVGLTNVDNTSDEDKPVSTAQSTAIGLKADKTYVDDKVLTDVPLNAKFTDTVYTLPSTLPVSMITGLPTSLPANGGNADTVGGFTVGVNVPADAKLTDTITTINGKTGTITKTDITALGIPAKDTTYGYATPSSTGLMGSYLFYPTPEFNRIDANNVHDATYDLSVTDSIAKLDVDKADKTQVLTDVPANAKFTDTTYSEITEAEINTGSASTLRTITARRVTFILSKVSALINSAIAGLTKASVGLGNVDNTSDANKPVSTAQQTALNAKIDANKFQVVAELPASPVTGVFYFIKE